MRRAPLAFLLLLLASAVTSFGAERARTLALALEPMITLDPTISAPARHGVEKLTAALRARGWAVEFVASATAQRAATGAILVARRGGAYPIESFDLRKTTASSLTKLDLTFADDRALMYALLDLAERVGWARDPAEPFSEVRDVYEHPTVGERSLAIYASHRAEWERRFYDERYWTRYFDLLAANRFNGIVLVFGQDSGGFLAPAYPYFFPTPGFPGVRMPDVSASQQQANLAALKRIVTLAHARGITVTLNLRDHNGRGATLAGGADWLDAYQGRPIPNRVSGLTTDNLRDYTFASLKELVARVPGVDRVEVRVDAASGITNPRVSAINVLGFQAELPSVVWQQTPGDSFNEGLDIWAGQMGPPFPRKPGASSFISRLGNAGTSRILLWGDPDYVRRTVTSVRGPRRHVPPGLALYLTDLTRLEVAEPLATKMAGQRPDASTFDLMPARYRYYEYEFERYWAFFRLWGRLGYDPTAPAEVWQQEFIRRFGPAAAPHVEAGLARASQVLPMLVASSSYPEASLPADRGWPERQTLGDLLDNYAKNTGSAREQFETFEEASRRILAEGTTTKRTPDAVARWLHAAADDILASVRAAEATVGRNRSREFEATLVDLKILAQLARFHAYRATAAIHYNLFKRGLRLAELLKATYDTRDVVAAWRELVAVAGDRYHHDLAFGARSRSLAGHWRDELVKLEHDLKELEAQCCPPDEALLREKVWEPAKTGDLTAPVVAHNPIATALPGRPLRIVAQVTDPSGVKSVALRYRRLGPLDEYATLEMQPTGQLNEYAATIPGDFFTPGLDTMYYIAVTDRAGNGANWPDLSVAAPYLVIRSAQSD